MNEKQIEAACGNHAFYYTIGMEICNHSFIGAFLESLYDERVVLYGIEHATYSGYIEIDTTDIKNQCLHGGMVNNVCNGLLRGISSRVPQMIAGEMNTDVTIVQDIYKFSFKIVKYERDMVHGYEPIADPTLADEGEQLRRLVELKVTVIPPNERHP